MSDRTAVSAVLCTALGTCLVVLGGSFAAGVAAGEPPSASRDGRPAWDNERAQSFLGKYILIGLTYEAEDGVLLRREQLHGRIAFAHPTEGFCVSLEGQKFGMIYWMPPDLRPFTAASPGEYRLRSTGEIVSDPDLIADWIVTEHTVVRPAVELRRLEPGPCRR